MAIEYTNISEADVRFLSCLHLQANHPNMGQTAVIQWAPGEGEATAGSWSDSMDGANPAN